MRRSPALAASAAILGACLVAAADGPSRRFQSAELRCAFAVPRGWEIVRQVGYPRVVVLATGADGARLNLAVQRVSAGTSALTLAADARAALERQRFTDLRVVPEGAECGGERPADAMRLDATTAAGQALRQEYLVDGDLAYVLTVTTPQKRIAADFCAALRALAITTAAGGDGGTP
jgi:hypothetical protein